MEFRSAVRMQKGIIGPSYAQLLQQMMGKHGFLNLLGAGDGDSRHKGFKVQIPDAFEIASNAVTVGRLPHKADMVVPVATVSGLHARIQKKGGYLVVTDLDSTNGTFINEKRLRSRVAAYILPCSWSGSSTMSNIQRMRKNLRTARGWELD